MDAILNFAQWIANNIFMQPAILLGIVAWVGLVAQKKSFSQTVLGTLKTIVGFMILNQGAGILVGAISAFQPLLESVLGIQTAGLGEAKLDNFIATHGGSAALIMTFGFLLNLLIARFTKFKYIYLTGHLMWWVALTMTAVVIEVSPNASQVLVVALGSIVCGVYWTLSPAFVHSLMKKVTNMDAIAYGHTSSSSVFVTGILGKFVGKPEQSTEKFKLPKWLEFFRDVTAGTAFILALLLVVLAVIGVIRGTSGTTTFGEAATYILNQGIIQGLTFAVGLTVLLFGVRMLIAEIVPAFRGFAMKIVPDAKPALDCPVVFDYAPTAVLFGFLGSTVAFLLLMILFGPILGWTVIVPAFLEFFFPGGACGVFGNSVGGIKGAILGGAILGAMIAIGQAIVTPMLSATAPEISLLGDSDWYILVLIFKPLFGLFLK
jgi:PTS system ascorbate-specific IIC component